MAPVPFAARWRGLARTLAGLLLAFSMCEGLARLALAQPALLQRVAGRGDVPWRLSWVRRQSHGASIYYSFDVHHPVRGWAVRPGVRDLAVFDGRRLNTNSAGARGLREFEVPKPAGLQRVLVFGDSFTFGDEVSDDQTYAHFLAERLPGVEVVNLGVHGYGHDQMLLYLREVGARYQPDVVLLGFVADDMERNLLGFRDFAKPRFELQDGSLRLVGTPVPTPEQVLAREPWRSRFFDLLILLRDLARARGGQAQERMQALSYALLDEFARETVALGARPAFAYLPVYGEIDKPDMGMTGRERRFFGYCRDRGIQSIYLRPFFLKRLRAGVSFKTYGHWDALEHSVAAEGMAAYLLEKGLLRSSGSSTGGDDGQLPQAEQPDGQQEPSRRPTPRA